MTITRTPSRCIGCGRQLGQTHALRCMFARLTTTRSSTQAEKGGAA